MTKLKYDRELQKLKLDSNLFDIFRMSNHYPAFMELFIIYNTTLQVLSLKNCYKTKDDRGADYLCEAIGLGMMNNLNLKELYLSGNQITVRPRTIANCLLGCGNQRIK